MEVGNTDIAISYDPTEPDEERSIVWLSYCIGRLAYVVEHRKDYPKKIRGELVPTFKEESRGRFVGLDTYLAMVGSKIGRDEYWEDVKRISDAGFLDEYVWSTFRRPTWPEKDKPKKLSDYEKWKAVELVNHKPQTYGSLVSKKG